MTLGRSFDARRNSLNALRLLLATLVIVSHTWPLTGRGDDPSLGGGPNLGTLAVGGFFAISGWLITGSRLSVDTPAYLWRRFLRIYPGFWTSLLVVAFVFAPLSGGSFSVADSLGYVWRNASLHITQERIGGTLDANPYSGVWNGPLWTLLYECSCYLIIALLISVSRRHIRSTVALGVVGCTAAQLAFTNGVINVPAQWMYDFTRLAVFFFAGSLLYLHRDRVADRRWLAAGAGVTVLAASLRLSTAALAAIPAGYLLIWLGAHLGLHRVGRRNDLSYGVYVYGWPVQQLAVTAGLASLAPAVFIAVVLAVVLPLAAASWFLVERPAMRLKSRAGWFGGSVRPVELPERQADQRVHLA